MSIIFISHSREDDEAAIRLRDWLRDGGHKDVFLDLDPLDGLAPGQRWQQELRSAGHRCVAVLVLISPSWAASKWCISEFLLSVHLGKRIFPVMVAPTDWSILPGELAGSFQIVDISSSETELDGLAQLGIGLRRAGLGPTSFPWPPESEPDRSPYRGLAALEEQDAGIFFGRENAITGALDRLRQMRDGDTARMLVILGASGAGKSSFLRAGLMARLRNDPENFALLPVLRPGSAAKTGRTGFDIVLGRDSAELPDVLSALNGARASAIDRLKRYADAAGETWDGRAPTVILPIDQAEEFGAPENAEAKNVLSTLAEAVRLDGDFILCAVIRSDSYEVLQNAIELADTPQNLITLPPLSSAAFRDVIEGPAKVVRPPIAVESALSERLINELDQGDALPLLAFALETLNTMRGGDEPLSLKLFEEELGGLEGIIQAAVDRAMSDARKDTKLPSTMNALMALAKKAFIPELVTLDSVGAEPRRRTVPLVNFQKETLPLIKYLANKRIVTTDTRARPDGRPETTVEIAHEAILRTWPDLAAWIEEERDFLITRERLEAQFADWLALSSHQRVGSLLAGNLLARAWEALTKQPERFQNNKLRKFIEASYEAEQRQNEARAASVAIMDKLRESNAALEEAARIKTAFIKHVGYELRSPLTSIIGFAQLLDDAETGPLNSRQRDYLDFVLSSTQSLVALVDNILDLATVDAGIMNININTVEFLDVLEGARDALLDRIMDKGISVHVNVPSNIGSIKTDAARLRQVIYNLLANAIDHSDVGQSIKLTSIKKSDKITFEVIDEGSGIHPHDIARVFEPFWSGQSEGRAGMGLSISRALIELLDGTINIQSELGKGTTVTCQIPSEY